MPWGVVAAMYRDYAKGGMSLEEVGRRHGGRNEGSVWDLFHSRGLAMRGKGHGAAKGRENREAVTFFQTLNGAGQITNHLKRCTRTRTRKRS